MKGSEKMNNQEIFGKTNGEQKTDSRKKYIVMDILFYGSSMNYDQGTGNYQELKKITKWDGQQYVLVSRYALRYSILHWANNIYPNDWKLAGKDVLISENEGVARLKSIEELKNENLDFKKVFDEYPEFDLFGFMSAPKKHKNTKKGKNEGEEGEKEDKNEIGPTLTRTSPVKISHAISLTPYRYDSQFTANLDIVKRAGGTGSNPVTIEEKKDFYVYNVVMDVDRIGKYLIDEHGKKEIGDISIENEKIITRILNLVEVILNLKREIKGRMEDLSPWLVICGLYNNGKYETYMDKIELAKSHIYKIKTTTSVKEDNGKKIEEIENEIIDKDAPKFKIDIKGETGILVEKEKIKNKIEEFLKNKNDSTILIYKKDFIQTEPIFKNDSNKNTTD
ncbi:MAG: type I-B CRISPR-associated protein Cas7/Cst2/DevR [Thermoplasmata archaeon]